MKESAPSSVQTVSGGNEHSLVVKRSSGRVYSFGGGYDGALGHGDHERQFTPRVISALEGVRCVAVAAGYSHSLVQSEAGQLYSFGQISQPYYYDCVLFKT